jgi:sarcosine oxidase
MTSPLRYDVVVAGLGAMGSATAYHLAARGARVLGLDRFAPPHALGSSHGKSRIIREAYFEDPLYVPLVRRAYECWSALERESGRRLFLRTGGLMVGPPDGELVTGAVRSATEHGLPYELLAADAVRRRVPGFLPRVDMVGVWEPRAGLLLPELAIAAQLALAAQRGAVLRTDEPVLAWRAGGDVDGGVEITTPRGTYRARRLVLALGAWTRALLPELDLPLTVERNAVYWFRPARATPLFAPERFPIFICETAPERLWYGFPDTGDGVKVALHHQGEAADPETVRRTVAPEEVARVRAILEVFMPAAEGPLVDSTVCLYTNTPDRHFLIDAHPAHPAVLIASPCSGHGFKFAPAIGELLAALASGETPRFDLAPFRLDRLRAAVPRREAGADGPEGAAQSSSNER